jgi:hypothetical protein
MFDPAVKYRNHILACCDEYKKYILKADTGNTIYPAAFNCFDPAALTKGIILTPAVRYREMYVILQCYM